MTSHPPATPTVALPPIFTFSHESQSHPIRTVREEGHQLWFVAKDICDALGLTNSSRSLTRLDPDEKGRTKLSTPGGSQSFATVNQSGLFALVFQSRMSSARDFRKWLTGTVIPAIYTDGIYVRGEEQLQSASTPGELIELGRSLANIAANGVEAKTIRGLNHLEEKSARYDALKALNRGRKRRSTSGIRFETGAM